MDTRPLARAVRSNQSKAARATLITKRCHCGKRFKTKPFRNRTECVACAAYRTRTGRRRDPRKPDGRARRWIGKTPQDHHNYKPDAEAGEKTVRDRIADRYPDRRCINHPKRRGTVITFKDGDWHNTDPSNLLFRCMGCKLRDDGKLEERAEALRALARKNKRGGERPCRNCGKPVVNRYECGTCVSYKSLYKVPRPAHLFRPERGEGIYGRFAATGTGDRPEGS